MELGKFENASLTRQKREIQMLDNRTEAIEKKIRGVVEKYRGELTALKERRNYHQQIINLIEGGKINGETVKEVPGVSCGEPDIPVLKDTVAEEVGCEDVVDNFVLPF